MPGRKSLKIRIPRITPPKKKRKKKTIKGIRTLDIPEILGNIKI
jgi:hypothetical protein